MTARGACCRHRLRGQGLEVALEATTGWRFLAEELDRVGGEVHLAEVVQTSGLKGRGKRPKADWADARHLRELLLIGRLPESWIAPRSGHAASTEPSRSTAASSQSLAADPHGRRPRKTERPQPICRNPPITDHVSDPIANPGRVPK
jgi:hypothetical protein